MIEPTTLFKAMLTYQDIYNSIQINSDSSEWTLCKKECCKCCAWVRMAPKTLFDDNEEEGLDGGLKINTEFARRFEVRIEMCDLQ